MTQWKAPQTLDPTRVRAVITTKFSGTAYRSATIRRVESYSVSSQLDSDADPWQLEIGNPDKDLNPTLARDNEVRVQVYGAGATGSVPILSGITDDVTFTEQGTLILTGRDMSCIAVDSDHFPNIYRGMSPTKIIQTEAQQIKCATKFQIDPIVGGPLRQQTDGSEKFWEFWYRMVRKDGRWIWMLPDGTLVISKLNYNDPPIYHFISAAAKNPNNDGIPVESVNWHKTTQGRIGRLGIEWRTQNLSGGLKPTVSMFEDVTNRDWLKRPNKIIQDKHAVSQQSAYKVAVEELFETRVGAIEISLTVQDPGYMIRQNRMALVEIPEMGIKGEWYVVGSTMHGDTSGFMQEVRLREKKFAISRRVPDDPVWTVDTSTNTGASQGEPSGKAAADIFKQMNGRNEWWDCYLSAAMKWRGLYDLALFMATLLAITDHETGGSFINERSNDANDGKGNTFPAPGEHNKEWYDIRKNSPTPQELDDWHRNFANDGPDSYLPAGYHCAVGPMQIFNKSVKEEADQMGGGPINEFFGNRWVPCDSIMAAAHLLNGIARTTNGSQADLWCGVCKYGGYQCPCAYGQDIENRVLNSPGWLQLVTDALASVQTAGTGDNPPGTYVAPFSASAVTPERTDQGVDYSAPYGTKIYAMGNATACIYLAGNTPTDKWPPWFSYQLTDGSNKGAVIFIAENIQVKDWIIAALKRGEHPTLAAGDEIAFFTGGIETGYAANTGSDSPCTPYGNNPDGTQMPGGKAMARFMKFVGVPVQQDPGPGSMLSPCLPKA